MDTIIEDETFTEQSEQQPIKRPCCKYSVIKPHLIFPIDAKKTHLISVHSANGSIAV
jgi:hypothetical protein